MDVIVDWPNSAVTLLFATRRIIATGGRFQGEQIILGGEWNRQLSVSGASESCCKSCKRGEPAKLRQCLDVDNAIDHKETTLIRIRFSSQKQQQQLAIGSMRLDIALDHAVHTMHWELWLSLSQISYCICIIDVRTVSNVAIY